MFIEKLITPLNFSSLTNSLVKHYNTFCYIIVDKDDCDPNPCQNGGICLDGVDSHTCNCISGYEGDNCEIGNIKDYLIIFERCDIN